MRLGLNISLLVSVTKDYISLGESAVTSIPYWIILLIGIFILATFPELALFLPTVVL